MIPVPGAAVGTVSLEIWKSLGGNGSCAGTGNYTSTAVARNLSYQLLDATGKEVKALGAGSFYGGGITIDTAKSVMTVDTSKFSGGDLVQGAYRLVAFEPGNPKIRVEVPIRVAGTTALGHRTRVFQGSKKKVLPDVLGRKRERVTGPVPLLRAKASF